MDNNSIDNAKLLNLDIQMLQPNPLQVRSLIKSESLVDLVESIKEHGILEPLVVAKTPAGYQIIAGERRWRASKIVGLKTVPVIVKETSTQGMLEMALVENVQREELNPIERAQGFNRLIDEFALGVTEISKRIGKSPAYVSNTLRLLALPDAIKDGLISQDITEGHARAIAGLTEINVMINVYKQILAEDASVRRAEELVRKIKENSNVIPATQTQRIQSVTLEEFEKELSGKLDARVTVNQSTISAKIQILFKGSPESTTTLLKKVKDKLLS